MSQNNTMHGYICIEAKNRRYAYSFEDDVLKIYSKDSLPLEEKDKINISFNSELPYVIGNDLDTGKNIVFFINSVPFNEEGPIIWSSTTRQVYYYFSFYSSSGNESLL